MDHSKTAIDFTSYHANELADYYDRLRAPEVHHLLLPYLKESGGLALDVGAGSGRDSIWLAGFGYSVFAAEPSEGIRAVGERRCRGHSVEWVDDRLPHLSRIKELGIEFDVILLSAVMMFIDKVFWKDCAETISSLAKKGGLVAASFLLEEEDLSRGLHFVSRSNIDCFARLFNADVLENDLSSDLLNRRYIWEYVVLRNSSTI